MKRWIVAGCAALAWGVANFEARAQGAPAAAPNGAPARVDVREDLFAVITLRGKPCGEVIQVDRLAENDYAVVCRSGDRYRVHVRDGRVLVEPR